MCHSRRPILSLCDDLYHGPFWTTTNGACRDPCHGALMNYCSNDVSMMNWNFYVLYPWWTTMTTTLVCPCPFRCPCLCHVVNCCSYALFCDLYRDPNDFYREMMTIFSPFHRLHWSMAAFLCRGCVHGLDLCLCSTIYESCCYAFLYRDVYLCCCHCATKNVYSLFGFIRNINNPPFRTITPKA